MPRHARTFLALVSALLAEDGYAPIAGLLFARLLVSAEPMALGDLARELGVSKASASIETRRLETHGILVREVHPGDRKVYYRVADDVAARVLERRLRLMRRFRGLVLDAARALPARDAAVRRRLAAFARDYGAAIRSLGGSAR